MVKETDNKMSKILKHRSFNMEYKLIEFVNENKICKKDIQQITTSMDCHVWYWVECVLSEESE